MDLTNALKNIQLPPVVVKIDEESMRTLYVWGVLLMATGIFMWVVVARLTNND